MSDTSTPANTDATVDPGKLSTQIGGVVVRAAAQAVGGFLVAHGVIASSAEAQFESAAIGLALIVGAGLWSAVQKWLARKKLITAINAPPPPAPAA